MNLQSIFDNVLNHLRKQNAKSIDLSPDPVSTCLYRSQNGFKCAAGCLIPDEFYHTDMENKNWPLVVEEYNLPKYLKEETAVKLVGFLQMIHDRKDVNDWEDDFKKVAVMFDLNYNLSNKE